MKNFFFAEQRLLGFADEQPKPKLLAADDSKILQSENGENKGKEKGEQPDPREAFNKRRTQLEAMIKKFQDLSQRLKPEEIKQHQESLNRNIGLINEAILDNQNETIEKALKIADAVLKDMHEIVAYQDERQTKDVIDIARKDGMVTLTVPLAMRNIRPTNVWLEDANGCKYSPGCVRSSDTGWQYQISAPKGSGIKAIVTFEDGEQMTPLDLDETRQVRDAQSDGSPIDIKKINKAEQPPAPPPAPDPDPIDDGEAGETINDAKEKQKQIARDALKDWRSSVGEGNAEQAKGKGVAQLNAALNKQTKEDRYDLIVELGLRDGITAVNAEEGSNEKVRIQYNAAKDTVEYIPNQPVAFPKTNDKSLNTPQAEEKIPEKEKNADIKSAMDNLELFLGAHELDDNAKSALDQVNTILEKTVNPEEKIKTLVAIGLLKEQYIDGTIQRQAKSRVIKNSNSGLTYEIGINLDEKKVWVEEVKQETAKPKATPKNESTELGFAKNRFALVKGALDRDLAAYKKSGTQKDLDTFRKEVNKAIDNRRGDIAALADPANDPLALELSNQRIELQNTYLLPVANEKGTTETIDEEAIRRENARTVIAETSSKILITVGRETQTLQVLKMSNSRTNAGTTLLATAVGGIGLGMAAARAGAGNNEQSTEASQNIIRKAGIAKGFLEDAKAEKDPQQKLRLVNQARRLVGMPDVDENYEVAAAKNTTKPASAPPKQPAAAPQAQPSEFADSAGAIGKAPLITAKPQTSTANTPPAQPAPAPTVPPSSPNVAPPTPTATNTPTNTPASPTPEETKKAKAEARLARREAREERERAERGAPEAPVEDTESSQKAVEKPTESEEVRKKNFEKVGQEQMLGREMEKLKNAPINKWGIIETYGKLSGTNPFVYMKVDVNVRDPKVYNKTTKETKLYAYSPQGGYELMDAKTGEWKSVGPNTPEVPLKRGQYENIVSEAKKGKNYDAFARNSKMESQLKYKDKKNFGPATFKPENDEWKEQNKGIAVALDNAKKGVTAVPQVASKNSKANPNTKPDARQSAKKNPKGARTKLASLQTSDDDSDDGADDAAAGPNAKPAQGPNKGAKAKPGTADAAAVEEEPKGEPKTKGEALGRELTSALKAIETAKTREQKLEAIGNLIATALEYLRCLTNGEYKNAYSKDPSKVADTPEQKKVKDAHVRVASEVGKMPRDKPLSEKLTELEGKKKTELATTDTALKETSDKTKSLKEQGPVLVKQRGDLDTARKAIKDTDPNAATDRARLDGEIQKADVQIKANADAVTESEKRTADLVKDKERLQDDIKAITALRGNIDKALVALKQGLDPLKGKEFDSYALKMSPDGSLIISFEKPREEFFKKMEKMGGKMNGTALEIDSEKAMGLLALAGNPTNGPNTNAPSPEDKIEPPKDVNNLDSGEIGKVVKNTWDILADPKTGKIARTEKNLKDAEKDLAEVNTWLKNPFRGSLISNELKAKQADVDQSKTALAKLNQYKANLSAFVDDKGEPKQNLTKEQLESVSNVRTKLGLPALPRSMVENYDAFQKEVLAKRAGRDRSIEVDYAAINQELKETEAVLDAWEKNLNRAIDGLDTAAGVVTMFVPGSIYLYSAVAAARDVGTGRKTPEEAAANFVLMCVASRVGGAAAQKFAGSALMKQFAAKHATFFSKEMAPKVLAYTTKMATGTVSGGAMSATNSGLRNTYAVATDKKEVGDAIKDTLWDTGVGAGTGLVLGGAMQKLNIQGSKPGEATSRVDKAFWKAEAARQKVVSAGGNAAKKLNPFRNKSEELPKVVAESKAKAKPSQKKIDELVKKEAELKQQMNENATGTPDPKLQGEFAKVRSELHDLRAAAKVSGGKKNISVRYDEEVQLKNNDTIFVRDFDPKTKMISFNIHGKPGKMTLKEFNQTRTEKALPKTVEKRMANDEGSAVKEAPATKVGPLGRLRENIGARGQKLVNDLKPKPILNADGVKYQRGETVKTPQGEVVRVRSYDRSSGRMNLEIDGKAVAVKPQTYEKIRTKGDISQKLREQLNGAEAKNAPQAPKAAPAASAPKPASTPKAKPVTAPSAPSEWKAGDAVVLHNGNSLRTAKGGKLGNGDYKVERISADGMLTTISRSASKPGELGRRIAATVKTSDLSQIPKTADPPAPPALQSKPVNTPKKKPAAALSNPNEWKVGERFSLSPGKTLKTFYGKETLGHGDYQIIATGLPKGQTLLNFKNGTPQGQDFVIRTKDLSQIPKTAAPPVPPALQSKQATSPTENSTTPAKTTSAVAPTKATPILTQSNSTVQPGSNFTLNGDRAITTVKPDVPGYAVGSRTAKEGVPLPPGNYVVKSVDYHGNGTALVSPVGGSSFEYRVPKADVTAILKIAALPANTVVTPSSAQNTPSRPASMPKAEQPKPAKALNAPTEKPAPATNVPQANNVPNPTPVPKAEQAQTGNAADGSRPYVRSGKETTVGIGDQTLTGANLKPGTTNTVRPISSTNESGRSTTTAPTKPNAGSSKGTDQFLQQQPTGTVEVRGNITLKGRDFQTGEVKNIPKNGYDIYPKPGDASKMVLVGRGKRDRYEVSVGALEGAQAPGKNRTSTSVPRQPAEKNNAPKATPTAAPIAAKEWTVNDKISVPDGGKIGPHTLHIEGGGIVPKGEYRVKAKNYDDLTAATLEPIGGGKTLKVFRMLDAA